MPTFEFFDQADPFGMPVVVVEARNKTSAWKKAAANIKDYLKDQGEKKATVRAAKKYIELGGS